jgi:hypothetical protein
MTRMLVQSALHNRSQACSGVQLDQQAALAMGQCLGKPPGKPAQQPYQQHGGPGYQGYQQNGYNQYQQGEAKK